MSKEDDAVLLTISSRWGRMDDGSQLLSLGRVVLDVARGESGIWSYEAKANDKSLVQGIAKTEEDARSGAVRWFTRWLSHDSPHTTVTVNTEEQG